MFPRPLTEAESEDVADALRTYENELERDHKARTEAEMDPSGRLLQRVRGLREEWLTAHRFRFPYRLDVRLPSPGADPQATDDPVVRLTQRMYHALQPEARQLLETDLDSDGARALHLLLARSSRVEEGPQPEPVHHEEEDPEDDEASASRPHFDTLCMVCRLALRLRGEDTWEDPTGQTRCGFFGQRETHEPACSSVSASGTKCELSLLPGAHGPFGTVEEANAVRHRGRNAAGLRVAWRPGNGQPEEVDLMAGLSIEELFEEAGRALRARAEAQGFALIRFITGWTEAGSDRDAEPEEETAPMPSRGLAGFAFGGPLKVGGPIRYEGEPLIVDGRHDRGFLS
jgi:hypothetical protein